MLLPRVKRKQLTGISTMAICITEIQSTDDVFRRYLRGASEQNTPREEENEEKIELSTPGNGHFEFRV